VGCNFDEAEGGHLSSSLSGHEDEHFAFLRTLDARWRETSSPVVFRELARARQLLIQPLPTWQWRGHTWPENTQVMPFAMVNVAHDGGFSTFSPELIGQVAPEYANFVFGNVNSGSYVESGNSTAFRKVWAAVVRGVLACDRSCAHFEFCGGGSPANKFYELRDLGGAETLYCRSMVKRPFDLALEQAESMLHRYGHTAHA
jgi:uncharacterized protein